MGRRPKQTFLQKIHMDGQQAHEKMLEINSLLEKSKSKLQELDYILSAMWGHSEKAAAHKPAREPSPRSSCRDAVVNESD